MSVRPRRILGTALIAITLGTALTSCEPPPPRPVFHAVGTASGPDAIPGDGVCATSAGTCSLEAAVQEANAVPRARIVSAGGNPDSPLVVTGDVELGPPDDWDSWTYLSGTEVHVAEGGVLRLRDVGIGALRVDGTVIAERLALGFDDSWRPEPTALDIGPTGTVIGVKVDVMGWVQRAIHNEGHLSLRYATIWAASLEHGSPHAAIATGASGSTTLGAVHVLGSGGPETVDACGGTPPVSEGGNVSYDSTCDLAGPGDRQDLAVVDWDPEPDSPLVDAVPLGTLGCQLEPSDAFGVIQAIDGDEDGVVACDIGYGYER